ncbi:23S rRNA pseudouridine955/2504/2580 synthase [Pontibacter ummariensis]|uniref:23S rRNA pseudouridine955/2504/2580 synthase n=1 Tax=Pontibacter ummariensis TaxID=1610492 RepID=A0A239B2A9_9BACT|nr:RluA family pseudouridine synthase [Pontibacter ummariensis]PRY16261.1 23S rRNA pseudouridine955/2504/2580 synthase [Pontibacter ummariensis]SNS02085.1 23S rRNA pseudouridine955/2504/2580 synthase [Pontibacter ummariensis]
MKYPVFKDLIIFENEDYVVVNKPPFLATLEDRTPNTTNLLKIARQYNPNLQACHRLDKDTSGCLVFAKNAEAYRHLAMQFEAREVYKVYHAVTWGTHKFEEELVNRAILPNAKGVAKLSPQGKPAETYFNTLETYGRHTLVECLPVTGRLHQIRVHLAFLGAPIVSDELYGGEHLYLSSLKRGYNLKQNTEELPLIKRFALHSFNIGFILMNSEPVKVEAPYPKDFAVLVKQLRAH